MFFGSDLYNALIFRLVETKNNGKDVLFSFYELFFSHLLTRLSPHPRICETKPATFMLFRSRSIYILSFIKIWLYQVGSFPCKQFVLNFKAKGSAQKRLLLHTNFFLPQVIFLKYLHFKVVPPVTKIFSIHEVFDIYINTHKGDRGGWYKQKIVGDVGVLNALLRSYRQNTFFRLVEEKKS